MKRNKKAILCCVLLVLAACVLPMQALAASTADAKETVDIARACSLTLTYRADAGAFAGQEVSLYMVAALDEEAQYRLAEPFSSYPISIETLPETTDWQALAATVEAYALADSVAPVQTARTDADGKVCFFGLTPGIYLASRVEAKREETTYRFAAFLIAVPGVSAAGSWEYDLAAAPKFEKQEPDWETVTYTVVKTWKDAGHAQKRPKSVTMEIYKEGVLQETQVLNAQNQWKYSWQTQEDGKQWTVVERGVGSGYQVRIYRNGYGFSVVNTYPGGGKPPKTGEDAACVLWVGALLAMTAAAGALLRRGMRHA